jgi:hypothetical protein
MRMNNNDPARMFSWAALIMAITLALPALGQTTYPMRVRGSDGLATSYTNGYLVIEFAPGAAPAIDGLRPGQGSWLDRGIRPTEPHVLRLSISEDQAQGIVEYLNRPDHYATFFCVNADQGYFVASNSEPFIPGAAPRGPGGLPVWASVLTIHGNSGSPGGNTGSPGGNSVVITDDRGGVGLVKGHDGKDHHDEGKDHHEEGKGHHEKDHDHHRVALVDPRPKPLIKQKSPAPPKAAPKSAPHPTPKKKK